MSRCESTSCTLTVFLRNSTIFRSIVLIYLKNKKHMLNDRRNAKAFSCVASPELIALLLEVSIIQNCVLDLEMGTHERYPFLLQREAFQIKRTLIKI